MKKILYFLFSMRWSWAEVLAVWLVTPLLSAGNWIGWLVALILSVVVVTAIQKKLGLIP